MPTPICIAPSTKIMRLKLMANQQSNRDNTRTFVLEDDVNPKFIIGYYTLTMILVDLTALPPALQKNIKMPTQQD